MTARTRYIGSARSEQDNGCTGTLLWTQLFEVHCHVMIINWIQWASNCTVPTNRRLLKLTYKSIPSIDWPTQFKAVTINDLFGSNEVVVRHNFTCPINWRLFRCAFVVTWLSKLTWIMQGVHGSHTFGSNTNMHLRIRLLPESRTCGMNSPMSCQMNVWTQF